METTFTKVGERYALGLERHLAHSPEKVWRVLTERELLLEWFPCDIEGEWRVGAPLQFTFLHGEGEGLAEEEMRGEVLAVDPHRLLEFRWGSSHIRCELARAGDGCKLIFSETHGDPSMGARNAAGWEMCIENLSLLLQGGTLAKFVLEVWQAKYQRYVEKFEPEFGPQQGIPDNHPAASEQRGEA